MAILFRQGTLKNYWPIYLIDICKPDFSLAVLDILKYDHGLSLLRR